MVAVAFALAIILSTKAALLLIKRFSASFTELMDVPVLSKASLLSSINFSCALISPPNFFQAADIFSNVAIVLPDVSLTFLLKSSVVL